MKNLFITGGNGEIGDSISRYFSNKKFNIIKPSSSELDCSSPKSIYDYFKRFNELNIHSYVHCAGINETKEFYKIKEDEFLKAIKVNALSFLMITQHLEKFFIESNSRICAISSLYGIFSRKKRISYTASKHALNGMVKNLSLELAPKKILVNSVSPGFISTKMTFKNNTEEKINDFKSKIPLSDLGDPNDVASIVYYLCTENNYITGQNIVVDGGYSVGGFQPN